MDSKTSLNCKEKRPFNGALFADNYADVWVGNCTELAGRPILSQDYDPKREALSFSAILR